MKKLWNATLPLVASGLMLSAATGAWHLILMEINFHREVRERFTAIEKKLGIEPTKESETHVAIRN